MSGLNLLNLLLVAAGGAIGSVARYVLSLLVLRATGSYFPFGTFTVNVIGCLLFGIIAGAADQRLAMSSAARVLLLVGVLGGFTTFSSYAFESYALLRDGQLAAASVNIVGQVIAGLVGVWIGFAVAR